MFGFFGLDWKTLTSAAQQITTHYILGIVSIALLLISIAGLAFLWRGSRITPENIEPRIRQWLDSFNLGTRRLSNPTCYFEFEVTGQTGIPIAVLRTKDHGHYITLVSKIDLGSEDKSLFDKLSSLRKEQFVRRLRVEAAKAKIAYAFDRNVGNITIEKRLPITKTFTEADLIDGISEVNFSALIVIETIVSLLAQQETRPPSPTPDKGASSP